MPIKLRLKTPTEVRRALARSNKRFSAGLELDSLPCGWENVCGHLSGSEKESLLHYPEADLKKRVEHLKGVYKDGI